MLTLRQGSQAHRLVSILSFTGEFPIRSLHLLGKERVLRVWFGDWHRRQVFAIQFPVLAQNQTASAEWKWSYEIHTTL